MTVLAESVQAINQYPRPNNLRSLRLFLGMVGFYARFIPGFSELADELHEWWLWNGPRGPGGPYGGFEEGAEPFI